MHKLTETAEWSLQVELSDFDDSTYWATFDTFVVGDATSNYRLQVSGYNDASTLGDSLTYNNGRMFSTMDKDNDDVIWDCSNDLYGGGGGWFKDCAYSSLNGGDYGQNVVNRGIYWHFGKTRGNSVKSWKSSKMTLIRK